MSLRVASRISARERGATAVRSRVRLFRSDTLERLTIMPPRVFAATWALLLPLIGWAGWGAVGVAGWFGLVLAGLAGWSLFEYAMHRFLFHREPRTDLGRRFAFVMHGNHHADPADPHRSLMPLAVSLPWSGAIWAALALLAGRPGSVIFLGFAIGYVVYDSVHYACHQLAVKGRLMRALRRHHLRHHFGREPGHYAVTAIVWDRVFGTLVAAKGPPRPRT
jgi:sterol desaturase/sphingolipid hydroxylase (fatty acid hydroxylase superfamily)